MLGHRALVVAGLLAVGWAGPALAQDQPGPEGRGVVLYARGGGFSPLTHLDEADTVDFRTGFNVGGGVGYEFSRYVALRGNFTFARAEARDSGGGTLHSIGGTKFNRFLYDADLQLRYPVGGGVTPYVFLGGGAVTIDHDATPGQPTFTKGAGKVGVGFSYQIPRSNVGLYAEGTAGSTIGTTTASTRRSSIRRGAAASPTASDSEGLTRSSRMTFIENGAAPPRRGAVRGSSGSLSSHTGHLKPPASCLCRLLVTCRPLGGPHDRTGCW